MIVPGTRLLFWVAAIVLPFALLAAVAPGSTAVSLLFIGGFIVLTAVDAAGGRKNLAGIGVELPPIVRMSKDREAKIELRIRNERQQRQRLRVALAWPREIKAEEEVMEAVLPREVRMVAAWRWPCAPLKRGNLQIEFGLCRNRLAAGVLGGAQSRSGPVGSPRLSQSAGASEKTWRRYF